MGKVDCDVIDAVGSSLRHGPITEARMPKWMVSVKSTSELGDDSSGSDAYNRCSSREKDIRSARMNERAPSFRDRAWVCASERCCGVSSMASRACSQCGAARPLSTHALPDPVSRKMSEVKTVRSRASGSDVDIHLTALLGGLSLGSHGHTTSSGSQPLPSRLAEERIAIPRKKKLGDDSNESRVPGHVATGPLVALTSAAANSCYGGGSARVRASSDCVPHASSSIKLQSLPDTKTLVSSGMTVPHSSYLTSSTQAQLAASATKAATSSMKQSTGLLALPDPPNGATLAKIAL